MSARGRVIGAWHVERASRHGRRYLEVLPGAIVTAEARDSAERLRIALRDGPLDRPVPPLPDGNAALVRGLYRRSPKWMAPAPAAGRSPTRFGRVAVVGAGGVGANTAHLVANAAMADEVALIDIVPGLAASLALDLNHASGVTRTRSRMSGGTSLELVAGADVVVVTAGRPRAPGMQRRDLLAANRRTIRTVADGIRTQAPEAVVLVVTNPVEEMTAEMRLATELPRERVLGMAGTLDSARFREALARAAGVEVADVEAMVLGSHGDEMVPVVSRARIRGRPLERVLAPERIAECRERTVRAGGEVVALRRTGSASLAPAHAAAEVARPHARGEGRFGAGVRPPRGRVRAGGRRPRGALPPRPARTDRGGRDPARRGGARRARRRRRGRSRAGRGPGGGGGVTTLRSAPGGGRFEEQGAYVRAKRVGPFVFVAGTAAIEPSGRLHAPGDTHAQDPPTRSNASRGRCAMWGRICDR